MLYFPTSLNLCFCATWLNAETRGIEPVQATARKEVESFAPQQLDCVEYKMHLCTVLQKVKNVINKAFNSI